MGGGLDDDHKPPTITPQSTADKEPPTCIQDGITDTVWYQAKVNISGGSAGKGLPPPDPPSMTTDDSSNAHHHTSTIDEPEGAELDSRTRMSFAKMQTSQSLRDQCLLVDADFETVRKSVDDDHFPLGDDFPPGEDKDEYAAQGADALSQRSLLMLTVPEEGMPSSEPASSSSSTTSAAGRRTSMVAFADAVEGGDRTSPVRHRSVNIVEPTTPGSYRSNSTSTVKVVVPSSSAGGSTGHGKKNVAVADSKSPKRLRNEVRGAATTGTMGTGTGKRTGSPGSGFASDAVDSGTNNPMIQQALAPLDSPKPTASGSGYGGRSKSQTKETASALGLYGSPGRTW